MPKVLNRYQAIDLTHDLDDSVPTWRGGCGFHFEVKMDYDQGVRVLIYKCHAGVGTHMDAPSHFYRDGANISDIPLESLIVPACVIDVSAKRHPDLLINLDDIHAYESSYGPIPKGALVFGYTGWDAFWTSPQQYRNPDQNRKMHFPGFHQECVPLFLDREISGIGIDTLSPDGSTEGFPVHRQLLGNGKYIIENAANLKQMPASGAFVIALPLKITVGAESAMRLVGLVEEEKPC